jgi:hemerythrin-like domain-containing protein
MSKAMDTALRTIRSEHRSLGAVLHTLKAMIAEVADGRASPDFPLFWRVLYYIEAYPDRLHHPKEDQELFPRVRARSSEASNVIDELEAQHRECGSRLNEVRVALGHVEAGVEDELPRLKASVDAFAEFYWRHMEMEERQLLPLAEKHLSQGDWDAVGESFGVNRDPLQDDPEDKFWALLHDIVRRAPAPHGLGPAHASAP